MSESKKVKSVASSDALLDKNLSSADWKSKNLNIFKGAVGEGQPMDTLPASYEKKTYRMEGSDLLSRLNSFLPQLDDANKKLKNEIANNPEAAKAFDIENTEKCDEVVEFDISLVPDVEKTPLNQLIEKTKADQATQEKEEESHEIKISLT